MLRSVWFWVIAIGIGLLFLLGRDQISSNIEKIPLQTTPRQTDTRALASATPRIARTPTRVRVATPTARRSAALTPGTVSTPVGAPLVPKPTVARPTYTIYVVKKGDTLYRIAKRYHTTVATLQRINGITDPTKLAIGQELKVPRRAAATQPAVPTPKPGTRTYTVKKGDTLSSIARKFHTSVGTLQRLNHFPNPNRLTAGRVILVPAGSTSRPVAATPRVKPPTATRLAPNAQTEVRIMPVLTETVVPASSVGSTSGPATTPTPTPLPTLPSVCESNQEAALVWGVSFCIPPGWTLQEYAQPHRTAVLFKEEPTGDRSIYAISRLEGSPNAPLSWTMRQAKSAFAQEIGGLIPGGLAEPGAWSSATEFEIAKVKGQAAEAVTTYGKTGHRAHVRIIVFNAAGKRWRIVAVAPESLWQGYDVTVFPYIARTLEVF